MVKKILLIVSLLFSFSFLVIASIFENKRQYNYCSSPVKSFDSISCNIVDSLDILFGSNKKFIDTYKAQCLVALSYYPELRDVIIRFKFTRENTTMACRPSFGTILGYERSYNILINKDKHFEGILLSDVPFNAQIGIIGHEIAHILDYESRTIGEIIKVGFNYLNMKKKKQYEYSIDSLSIEKGLGWQLYDWAMFSMFESDEATEAYKQFKQEFYMTPEHILDNMRKNICYEEFFIP